MGLRFRKSLNLGGFRINFSKSGIGYSYGGKGARVTKMANGKKRATLSVPGTGISYVTEEGKVNNSKNRRHNVSGTGKQGRAPKGLLIVICILLITLAIMLIIISAVSPKQSESSIEEATELTVVSIQEVLNDENHPRIWDSVDITEEYVSSCNNSDLRMVLRSKIAKDGYDGYNSKDDGIINYIQNGKGETEISDVLIILDDKSVVPEMSVEKSVSLVSTFLPTDFYDTYKLDIAYKRESTDREIFTAAFRKQEQSYDHYYCSFDIIHMYETDAWIIETSPEAFGGLGVDKAREQETWNFQSITVQ